MQSWRSNIQCQLCPMTFSDQSAISAHYDTAHAQRNTRVPPPPRPEHPDAKYPCEVCGRKFKQSQDIHRHMRNVHGAGESKTFECDFCSKSFNRKDTSGKTFVYNAHCCTGLVTLRLFSVTSAPRSVLKKATLHSIWQKFTVLVTSRPFSVTSALKFVLRKATLQSTWLMFITLA